MFKDNIFFSLNNYNSIKINLCFSLSLYSIEIFYAKIMSSICICDYNEKDINF